MSIITSLWLSIRIWPKFQKHHKSQFFNEYLGYEFYNEMHIPDIKLNEMTKINCYELIIDFNI
jgi:hypothetical protein